MSSTIPTNVRQYLWDVNEKDLSTKKHSKFIIERVLEYGDLDSINWLKSEYSTEEIVNVLKSSNRLSLKTGNLYSLYFNVPKEEILCIRKPYTQKQNRF